MKKMAPPSKMSKATSKAKKKVAPLNEDIKAKVAAVFRRFDSNGDGLISRDELVRVMRTIGANRLDLADIERVILAADVNRDGVIDYDEFIGWAFARGGDQRLLLRDPWGAYAAPMCAESLDECSLTVEKFPGTGQRPQLHFHGCPDAFLGRWTIVLRNEWKDESPSYEMSSMCQPGAHLQDRFDKVECDYEVACMHASDTAHEPSELGPRPHPELSEDEWVCFRQVVVPFVRACDKAYFTAGEPEGVGWEEVPGVMNPDAMLTATVSYTPDEKGESVSAPIILSDAVKRDIFTALRLIG
mmetsp:Transcript_15145/g.35812  ORF Transcript_15145/g.35812 Transcript_15145/m.35812 type:complete len:300 (+) Transcript_15145:141-1040(+)